MNTLSMVEHKPSQKLHPLSLLAQAKSRQISGCLRVSSHAGVWSLYLVQGELIYASYSVDRFERLDRHLCQLGRQVISLVSAVRVQARLLFENAPEVRSKICPDYRALCWLVEQQHLTPDQAAGLIEELAKEVLESFLSVQEGSYELIEKDKFDEFQSFYRLDLRPLVEFCQERLRQRVSKPSLPTPSDRPNFATPNRELPAPTVTPASLEKSHAVATFDKKEGRSENVPLRTQYTIVCVDDSPTVLQA